MTGHRVLLTGGSGQVGRALLACEDVPFAIDAPGRDELDLQDADALRARVLGDDYAAVVSSGAYTAVDAAESDVASAWRINALAPAVLAAACRERAIPLVQLSTDYVFPGEGERPYRSEDPIFPLSVYGASKAGGELAVRASGCRHAILRTAWVMSATGRNFVRSMLAAGLKQDRLRVVADQHGSPTSARDLAFVVAQVTQQMIANPAQPSGTWHAANRGYASWHEVAQHVLASAGGALAETVVDPITTADYPTPARRPSNSRLDTSSLSRDFGIEMPGWRDSIGAIVAELEQGTLS
ncbi:MAG: dTDP-4-dehydrorhamnose reductase [Tsuneonella sp.]